MPDKLTLAEWVDERRLNTLIIAAKQTDPSQINGWLEDAEYWQQIADAIKPKALDHTASVDLIVGFAKAVCAACDFEDICFDTDSEEYGAVVKSVIALYTRINGVVPESGMVTAIMEQMP